MLFTNGPNHIPNLGSFGEENIHSFGKTLPRSPVEQHRVKDLLHAVAMLLEPRKRIGVARRRRTANPRVCEHWIELGVVKFNDPLAVNTKAEQPCPLRQVLPEAFKEPAPAFEVSREVPIKPSAPVHRPDGRVR